LIFDVCKSWCIVAFDYVAFYYVAFYYIKFYKAYLVLLFMKNGESSQYGASSNNQPAADNKPDLASPQQIRILGNLIMEYLSNGLTASQAERWTTNTDDLDELVRYAFMEEDPQVMFTTGDVGKICDISQQTAIRAYDRGEIEGFNVPGSKFRRIPFRSLIKFLEENDYPEQYMERARTYKTSRGKKTACEK